MRGMRPAGHYLTANIHSVHIREYLSIVWKMYVFVEQFLLLMKVINKVAY